ncbi:MAG: hypothetical protein HZY78_02555 [Burkholderiaceae bacterium]|nr:MAG: hypothetical protein HZY78_02555 [Burkholderiaceae bacterium]
MRIPQVLKFIEIALSVIVDTFNLRMGASARHLALHPDRSRHWLPIRLEGSLITNAAVVILGFRANLVIRGKGGLPEGVSHACQKWMRHEQV